MKRALWWFSIELSQSMKQTKGIIIYGYENEREKMKGLSESYTWGVNVESGKLFKCHSLLC